jgi:hypothetical protein
MKELTIFKANDGTLFGTAKECLEYEAMPKTPKKDYKAILEDITFATFDGIVHPKTVEELDNWVIDCTAVKIDSHDALDLYLDALSDKGYWSDGLDDCGIFYPDEYAKYWINLDMAIADYTKLKNRFNEQ